MIINSILKRLPFGKCGTCCTTWIHHWMLMCLLTHLPFRIKLNSCYDTAGASSDQLQNRRSSKKIVQLINTRKSCTSQKWAIQSVQCALLTKNRCKLTKMTRTIYQILWRVRTKPWYQFTWQVFTYVKIDKESMVLN